MNGYGRPLTPNQIIEGAITFDPSNLGPTQRVKVFLDEQLGKQNIHSGYVVQVNTGEYMAVIAHGDDRILTRDPGTLEAIADWCLKAAKFMEEGE